MSLQGSGSTRAGRAAWLILLLLLGTAAGKARGQDLQGPQTHVWLTTGAGFGSAGVSGSVAASLERTGWMGTVRYAKARATTGAGGLQVETYTDGVALLLGRTLHAGTTSADLSLGVGYARRWKEGYSACPSCPFGDQRRTGREDRPSSVGLAFDLTARETDGGRVGYGVQLGGHVGGSISYVTMAVLLDLGRVR